MNSLPSGLGKLTAHARQLRSLHSIIQKSGLLNITTPVSLRVIALTALSQPSPDMLPSQLWPAVLANCNRSLAFLTNDQEHPVWEFVEACLCLLDARIVGLWSTVTLDATESDIAVPLEWATRFIRLGVLLSRSISDADQTTKVVTTMHRCATLNLRILVGLTNSDKDQWSSAVCADQNGEAVLWAARTLVDADMQKRIAETSLDVPPKDDGVNVAERTHQSTTAAMDTLCLALALLTNLVHHCPNDQAGAILRDNCESIFKF